MEPRQPAAIGVETLIQGWGLPNDPITAARLWLERPDRGGRLDTDLRMSALRTIDVAQAHMLVLDELSTRLAHDLEETGVMDPHVLATAEEYAGAIDAFSNKLRDLLDPDAPKVDALERIDHALAAAAQGGLPALVDEL